MAKRTQIRFVQTNIWIVDVVFRELNYVMNLCRYPSASRHCAPEVVTLKDIQPLLFPECRVVKGLSPFLGHANLRTKGEASTREDARLWKRSLNKSENIPFISFGDLIIAQKVLFGLFGLFGLVHVGDPLNPSLRYVMRCVVSFVA